MPSGIHWQVHQINVNANVLIYVLSDIAMSTQYLIGKMCHYMGLLKHHLLCNGLHSVNHLRTYFSHGPLGETPVCLHFCCDDSWRNIFLFFWVS